MEYVKLPRSPEIDRDLALVVDEIILAYDIEKVIKENGGKLLESVSLFDVYKGEQVDEGKKSLAYSLKFRASDRTLTDEEVNNALKKVLRKLEEQFGAMLR
jgi:phenylalanyl-tRNA synthetase beta chain